MKKPSILSVLEYENLMKIKVHHSENLNLNLYL